MKTCYFIVLFNVIFCSTLARNVQYPIHGNDYLQSTHCHPCQGKGSGQIEKMCLTPFTLFNLVYLLNDAKMQINFFSI